MTVTHSEPLMTIHGPGARKRPRPRSTASTAAQRLAPGQPVTQLPPVRGPGALLALQRTVGNRAAMQLLRAEADSVSSPVQRQPQLTTDQRNLAKVKHLKSGRRKSPAGADTSSRLKEGLDTGTTAAGVPAATLGGFGVAVRKDDAYDENAKTLVQVGSQDQRDALKPASATAGTLTDVLALGSNAAAIFILAKNLRDEKGWARKRSALEITAQSAEAVSKTGKSLAGGSKAGAQIVATANSSSRAKEGVTASAGVAEAFNAVGAGCEALISGGKGLWGIIRALRGKAKNKKTEMLESVTKLFESGKSFLATINGVISSIRWFLKLAETAGDFVQAVPLVGSSIAIFTQAIDILVQGLKVIRQVVASAGAWLQKQKWNTFLNHFPVASARIETCSGILPTSMPSGPIVP